ncbi:MAG: energy transducer TonB [Verrucomicrobiota bacterium]
MRTLPFLLTMLVFAGCATDPTVALSGQQMSAKDSPNLFAVMSGQHDTAPRFLSGRGAIYPPQLAYKDILSGTAKLSYTITKEGRVADIRVVEASHPQFAAGVAHVMPSWRFEPARLAGVPVAVVAQTSVTFSAPSGM